MSYDYILIKRLHEVPLMTREQVAEAVSRLIHEYGDGFVKPLSPEEIIKDRARYYAVVLMEGLIPQKLIGCFAVDRVAKPCAILKSVVIHKDFRGRGLGKKIVEIATSYALTERVCVVVHVRKDNDIMKHILEKLGYDRADEYNDTFTYMKNRTDFDGEVISTIIKQVKMDMNRIIDELNRNGIYVPQRIQINHNNQEDDSWNDEEEPF